MASLARPQGPGQEAGQAGHRRPRAHDARLRIDGLAGQAAIQRRAPHHLQDLRVGIMEQAMDRVENAGKSRGSLSPADQKSESPVFQQSNSLMLFKTRERNRWD